MSKFMITAPRRGQSFEIDFGTFVSIINGSTIVSLAGSDGFIELGLSENLQIHIESGINGGLHVSVYSTLNPEDIAPVRLRVIAEGKEASAALVEKRLYAIRQIYAIAYLLNKDQEAVLMRGLNMGGEFDFEELLSIEERLYIQAAGPGSFWVTIASKIAGAGQKALNTLSLIYGEGRELLLRRIRAVTEKMESEAELERIKVAREKFNLAEQRTSGIIDLINKVERIKDPESRRITKEAMWKNAQTIDPEIRGFLPPAG